MLTTLAVVCVAIGFILLAIQSKARSSLRKDALDWMSNTGFHDFVIAFQPGDAIGVDYDTKRVALSSSGANHILNFADIISVEVAEDGATTSKTNRGGQVAGAAIGAIALGGVGAIIGGLSASSTTKQKVSKVTINIITSSRDCPFFEIKVYSDQAVEKGGLVYNHVTKDLMPWYGRLRAVMESAE